MKDEGSPQCFQGKIWEMPCLLDVAITHADNSVAVKTSGTWVTFIGEDACGQGKTEEGKLEPGPKCAELLPELVNATFPCAFVPGEVFVSGEGWVIGVTDQGVFAALPDELGLAPTDWRAYEQFPGCL